MNVKRPVIENAPRRSKLDFGKWQGVCTIEQAQTVLDALSERERGERRQRLLEATQPCTVTIEGVYDPGPPEEDFANAAGRALLQRVLEEWESRKVPDPPRSILIDPVV